MKRCVYILLLFILAGCEYLSQNNNVDRLKANAAVHKNDSTKAGAISNGADTDRVDIVDAGINTGKVTPGELMQFAETQIGVPYVYGSCDPKVGFDCSGFITYVFKHFNIQVPRSSYGFTHMGKTVPLSDAKRGDIILFTGTDSLANDIGHIGLVTANNNGAISFIHSTSGRQMAVTVTTLDAYYKSRFVRISRVFKQNG